MKPTACAPDARLPRGRTRLIQSLQQSPGSILQESNVAAKRAASAKNQHPRALRGNCAPLWLGNNSRYCAFVPAGELERVSSPRLATFSAQRRRVDVGCQLEKRASDCPLKQLPRQSQPPSCALVSPVLRFFPRLRALAPFCQQVNSWISRIQVVSEPSGVD